MQQAYNDTVYYDYPAVADTGILFAIVITIYMYSQKTLSNMTLL